MKFFLLLTAGLLLAGPVLAQKRSVGCFIAGREVDPCHCSRTCYTGPSQADIERERQERIQQERKRAEEAMHDANDRGVAAYQRGDWAAAVEYFRQALRENPDDPAIVQNLRQAQEQQRGAQERERQAAQAAERERARQAAERERVARIERARAQAEAEARDSQIRAIVGGIRNITVPPPLLPEEAAIAFGQIAPGDNFSKRVFLGTASGVAVADVFGKIGSTPLAGVKLILVAGKTFIAAEDAADVYLVKQSQTYEKALQFLKDDAKRRDFTVIVRAIKENRPVPENASIEMLRVAHAILDPKLGNSGARIAWNAMLSPEARNAALTQFCLEIGGEVLGGASKRMVARLSVQRLPAFREANEYLAKATYAFNRTSDPVARASLQEAIKQANDIIAQSYRTVAPGARGMEHITSIYAGNELERQHERPRR